VCGVVIFTMSSNRNQCARGKHYALALSEAYARTSWCPLSTL
jgi:hypothetical protein